MPPDISLVFIGVPHGKVCLATNDAILVGLVDAIAALKRPDSTDSPA